MVGDSSRMIPDTWQILKVGDITKFHKQGYYTKESYTPIGKYLLLRGTDMQNPIIDLSTTPKINANNADYEAYKVLEGDFLFVRSGAIGRYGIAKKDLPKSIFGSYLINFRFSDAIIQEYFGYFYESNLALNQIMAITQGGGNLNINAENIKALNILIPPKQEQKAIATALTDVDALITSIEMLIAKKEDIKTATMQQLLTGEKRLDGFSGEWVNKSLGELFDITAGKDLVKSQYSEKRDKLYQYPIYANSIYNNGIYGYSTFKENSENCITVTARGTLGVAFYRSEPFVAIGRLLVLKPKNKLNSYYATQVINLSLDFANESTSVPQLTAPQISKYEISIPAYNEQTAIASILSDMDRELEILKTRFEKIKAIKTGMMQELLTGKTRLLEVS